MESFDVRLLLDHHGFDGLQIGIGKGVHRLAHIFAVKPEHVARLGQYRDAAFIFITVEQHFPAVRHSLHLGLAIANAKRQPGVWHRIFACRIIGNILIIFGDIFEIRNLRLIERHQHIGRGHTLHKIVGWDDDVIARVSGAQLSEQFVVAGEQRHVDVYACAVLIIFQRGFTDIGVPIVEVQLCLFAIGKLLRFLLTAASKRAGQRETNGGNAHSL